MDKLDEVITAIRAAAIPISSRWIDAEGVAALLGYSRRTVLERIVCRPDFPKPLRIGQPRWKAREVEQWADDERNRAA